MNRKVIIIISAIILGLVAGLVLFEQNSSFFNPQKCEVTNMKLTYGSQTMLGLNIGGSPQAVISFTVRNLHSSSLTTVGLTVNGANYGLSTLQVPPGQLQDASLSLKNMVLSSSTTYGVELTFTFADGKYQTYSGSYTTPQFKGQAKVVSSSLTLGTYLSTFSLTIQNTGNLPITSAQYKVENYQFENSLPIGWALMPGDTATGGWSLWISYQVGKAYSVTIQVKYLDGSTSTINTSVIAQS